MDYRERYEDRQTAIRSALNGHQASIWTALPGIITSYDQNSVTAVVQASVSVLYTGPNGQKQWLNIPPLPDVPVVFPRGGQYTLTFPITQGDECLLVFSSRCIDNWWQQGGVQTQRELRMHDLSDGFAIPGPFSQATKISNLSTTTAQLRTADGTVFVEVDAANGKARLVAGNMSVEANSQNSAVTITAPTVTINSPTVTMSGNLNVQGVVTDQSGTKAL